MYEDIEFIINQNKRILFIGDEGLGKSQTIRLLLSINSFQNKVVVETEQEIEFIKRNLLVDSSVTFESYQSFSDVPKILFNLNQKRLPFISVINDISLFSRRTTKRSNFVEAVTNYLNELGDHQGLSGFLNNNLDLIVSFENKDLVKYYHTNQVKNSLAI